MGSGAKLPGFESVSSLPLSSCLNLNQLVTILFVFSVNKMKIIIVSTSWLINVKY